MTRGARFWLGALACVSIALGVAARGLECPGLYYDEVIQAEPALWFLRAEPAPPEVPGARSVQVFGRPFPWMTQPYMGALKSQLLVPVLALTGPDAPGLRAATLGIALCGLVCAMAFALRAFDLGSALVCGALLAVDPSFLFVARHDWGSFAIGFLLRCLALLALLSGWRARSAWRVFAGGLCAGLCVYNKIDGAVPLAAAGAALALSAPGWLHELRRSAALVAAGVSGALLGAAPMLVGTLPALAATRAAARAGGGANELSERWTALQATLDGSYFERLIRAGGSFERLAEQSAASATPFPALFLLASLALALFVAHDLRRGRPARGLRFALLAAWLALAGMLLTPRAVRIHHFLNAWPFPQLAVAVAASEAWRRCRGRVLARAAVALLLGAALVAALRVDLATQATLQASCGKGRWSDALERFAPELAREEAQVVCLDWGFAGPLRFAEPELAVEEPIWRLRRRRPVVLEGDARQVYLLHPPELEVFRFGRALEEALASLPPETATLRRHLDGSGDLAFLSLRFAAPHRLVYRRGRVEVELR